MQSEELFAQKKFLAAKLKGKSIFITGATGLIGSAVVRYLLKLNEELGTEIKVCALYYREEEKEQAFDGIESPLLRFMQGDVVAGVAYDGAVDYMIHCAGFSGGAKMHLKDPGKLVETGVLGTKKILDLAIEHRCKGFLYLSSYEVYGEESVEGLIDEEQSCRLNPLLARSLAPEIKLTCEAMLAAYGAKYGLPVFSARLTSTFGRGVQYFDPRFFAEFARCILEGRDIVLKSAGKTVRSYLDADDAAAAFLYILTCGESGKAYNVTNMANEISIKNLALKMIEAARAPVKLTLEETSGTAELGFRKEGRTVMDATKLMRLGWRPVYTLEETIEKMLLSMQKCKK